MRLFAFDLDGTLLTSEGQMSTKSIRAIEELKEQDKVIVIASGRTFEEIWSFVEKLSLSTYPHAYLIGYNGVECIHAMTRKSVFRQTITWNDIHIVGQDVMKYGLYLHVFEEKDVYLSIGTSEFLESGKVAASKGNFVDMTRFKTDNPVYKALIVDHPNRIDAYQKVVSQEVKERLCVFKSANMLIEFVHPLGTKGKALEVLASKLEIPQNDVFAFGDEENDLSMIAYAGYGIAMGNAKDHVKAVARYVTSSHNDEGIENALKYFNVL